MGCDESVVMDQFFTGVLVGGGVGMVIVCVIWIVIIFTGKTGKQDWRKL